MIVEPSRITARGFLFACEFNTNCVIIGQSDRALEKSRSNSIVRIMDPLLLTASLFFGTLGTAMFMFGKSNGKLVPLGSGIALMVLPCVLPGILSLTIVSSLVASAPFFIRE